MTWVIWILIFLTLCSEMLYKVQNLYNHLNIAESLILALTQGFERAENIKTIGFQQNKIVRTIPGPWNIWSLYFHYQVYWYRKTRYWEEFLGLLCYLILLFSLSGVLVWEIFTCGKSPYHSLSTQQVAEQVSSVLETDLHERPHRGPQFIQMGPM